MLARLSPQDRKTFETLNADERIVFERALSEMATGDDTTLKEVYALDYERQPVSPDVFFTDEYYIGKQGKSLYPIWRQELRHVLTSPSLYELALTGSIGSGKTTAAVMALCYKIYRISCLRDPQKFYGLMPGSMIAFGLFSLYKYKVATTSWHMLNTMVRESPYFKEHFQPDPEKTKDLVFPKNVYVATGASELQAIGENLFSVVIDEADFMKDSTTAEQRGQAEALHQAVRRRVESRFGQVGKMPPGIIILVSSKKTVDSYIERYVEDHRNDPAVHVCDYALWDVKPDRYPKERFRVWYSPNMGEGRILTADEPTPDTGKVLLVPDSPSVRRAFEEDPIAAARDLAGMSSQKSYRFVTVPASVMNCIDTYREHPFEGEHIILDYKTSDTAEDYLAHDRLFVVSGSRYQPKLHPEAPRYLHVDIGVTKDSAGIAMAHAGDAQVVSRYNQDGSKYQVMAPTIWVDLMLRIKPPRGSQIDLSKIRQLVGMLAEYGFPLKVISYDGYQSTDSIQLFRKQGFNADLLSMDKSPAPYLSLRQAMLEGRVKFYKYIPFLDEMLNLFEDPKTNKIDHPRSCRSLAGGVSVPGSKDVADAVAACCHHIMEDETLVSAPMSDRPQAPRPPSGPPPADDFGWIVDQTTPDSHRITGIR